MIWEYIVYVLDFFVAIFVLVHIAICVGKPAIIHSSKKTRRPQHLNLYSDINPPDFVIDEIETTTSDRKKLRGVFVKYRPPDLKDHA